MSRFKIFRVENKCCMMFYKFVLTHVCISGCAMRFHWVSLKKKRFITMMAQTIKRDSDDNVNDDNSISNANH